MFLNPHHFVVSHVEFQPKCLKTQLEDYSVRSGEFFTSASFHTLLFCTFFSTNIQYLKWELWHNPIIGWQYGQKVAYFLVFAVSYYLAMS